MVKHRIFQALCLAWCSADNKDRDLLCIGLSGGVDKFQAACAIGYAYCPQSLNPSIGISSEACTLLITCEGFEKLIYGKVYILLTL